MSNAISFEMLLDAYWGAAYREGAEKRTTDNGSAQRAFHGLTEYDKDLRAALAESQRREKVLRSAVEFAEKKAVEFRYPFLIQEMQKALAETKPGEGT